MKSGMAVAFDALRIAVAHVGQLSDRRMSHLWDGIFKSPAIVESGRRLYGIQLRYPAAARFTELKQLAAPATLDVPTLDIGVEDHGTGAPLSVSKTDEAVALLGDILMIEILLVRDLLSGRDVTVQLGHGTRGVLGEVETVIAGLGTDARGADVHAALRTNLSISL